ncbi:hypothetical protein [Bradyrhizobium sp. MOS002]|jgi:hypothetical protein|uniref:hypothetical protein n=1 Tax=Bradyrhizobium sp. MOS002 TaxID=2133947 RepID=UPI001304E7D6|nr:hypothetical protein [Bradyrhizobium sp. MOS002]
MLESLPGAIVEILLSAAWGAIIRFFGLENLAELATAIFGLGCIVIGFTACWLGH